MSGILHLGCAPGLYCFGVKTLALLLALLAQAQQSPQAPQAPQAAPPASLKTTLHQLREQYNEHQATFGATPEMTTAKHQLRDWFESRLAGLGENDDTEALSLGLHEGLESAGLICTDFRVECVDSLLGYVDDIRVEREGPFLTVVTATGIWCGYDESAYVYAWDGRQWRRVWEHEQNTYTQPGYLPQTIHDVQVSAPGANRERLIMALGSPAGCGGSFKNLYARVWRMDADNRLTSVLNWTEYGADGYPPIEGRVRADDVFIQFTVGGIADGEGHLAARHFKVDGSGTATQVDPIAGRPHDFVVEWLGAPWQESRARSESPSLEPLHAQLYRKDRVGVFPEPTLRCTAGPDLWQVTTRFYEGPKRYYRVRWKEPYSFTMVGVSEAPYPDCTAIDSRGDSYPDLLGALLR